MSNTSARSSSKERLLDAAVEIITVQGVHGLTMDNVAAAAGVTKGGVIYHFKTKEDLLIAVVDRLLVQLDAPSHAKAAESENPNVDFLMSSITETFNMREVEKALLSNLLAASFNYPHLVSRARTHFERGYQNCSTMAPGNGNALVIAAALDGISLLELLDLHKFNPEQRALMSQSLQKLAQSLL